jgi:carboxypeptidase Q
MRFFSVSLIASVALTFITLPQHGCAQQPTPSKTTMIDSAFIHKTYNAAAQAIMRRAVQDSLSYKRLQYLCDTFGARLSGTPALERAIDWVLGELKADGFENVRGEDVQVPYWKRGAESAELVTPRATPLAMLGLGGSIGTPPEGITAEVVVVKSFDELKLRAAEAKGKIVLFNAPFTNYGATVRYRTDGAIKAAEAGAVASLIRSVGPYSMRTPHTGSMRYQDSVKKIPHAAVSTEDADMLARMAERGAKPVVRLKMEGQFMPEATSRNVIAEIRGSEKPEEIVVMGGHIDSWDVGSGAMDDGGGCIATWQALLLLKQLGLKPRRTIRLALWTNEENGLRGGTDYAKRHGAEKHVLAFESDGGVFKPEGFGFTGSAELFARYKAVAALLAPIGAAGMKVGGGGADIGPLAQYAVPMMNIDVDETKYFWYHHTQADMPDKLNPDEINKCAAAIAVMMFAAADMP